MKEMDDNFGCLVEAVRRNWLRKVQLLLINKELVTAKDLKGLTAVHHAARLGRNEILKVLLNSCPYNTEYLANLRCRLNKTPLLIACQARRPSLDVCKTLVAAGADLSARSLTGHTALMFASKRSGTLPVVKFLVENGAEVLKAGGHQCYTPLCLAMVHAKDLELTRYLIPISDLKSDSRYGDDALSAAIVFFPVVVPDILDAAPDPPEEHHLNSAADFQRWDAFTRMLKRAPSMHMMINEWNCWVLPFHLAWNHPHWLKEALSLTPETAFMEYWGAMDAKPIDNWLVEKGYTNEESVEIYLEHVAPMNRQDPFGTAWWLLPKVIKKYFSPRSLTTEPSQSLQQACRIPARYHIRQKCTSDWAAYCWIRDSLPRCVKQFLLYESN